MPLEQTPSNRSLVLTLMLAVTSLVLVACGGGTAVWETKPGQCTDINSGSLSADGFVKEIKLVSCDDPHTHEIFAISDDYVATNSDLDGIYPGSEALETHSINQCVWLAEGYIGKPIQETSLRISYIYPSIDTWNDDNLPALQRNSICMLAAPLDDPKLNKSVKGLCRQPNTPGLYPPFQLSADWLILTNSAPSDVLRVRLQQQPTSPITLQFDPSTKGLQVEPSQKTFNSRNWSSFQDFKISKSESELKPGTLSELRFLVLDSDPSPSDPESGPNSQRPASERNRINIPVAIGTDQQKMSVFPNEVTIIESGNAALIGLRLNQSPTSASASVSITSDKPNRIVIQPNEITFSSQDSAPGQVNWLSQQVLYASAIADDKQVESEEVTIKFNYSDSLAGELDAQEIKIRVLDAYSEPSACKLGND